MARVHFVKKAQKDNAVVKKGESYYWWKFRFGGRRISATRPRPSQLTQSDYLSAAYGLQEQVEDLQIDNDNLGDVASELRNIADELQTLGSEQEDKISNMPDSLQNGEIAERLQARADACEEIAQELEQAASEIEDLIEPDMDDPAAPDVDEIEVIIQGISWELDP